MPKRTAHIFEEKWRSDDVKLQESADFESLLISERTLSGLYKAGYRKPSPIQLEAIPSGRFGADMVIQAKSGTGKTLVFTIISLDLINLELNFPQVLILAPTREIAYQICDVVKAVGSACNNLKCGVFIGGLPIESDLLNIQGCHVVVGTPGRITQLIDLKIFKAHSIRLLVLDEADQLLEASFKSPMDTIFTSLPEHKQIIATSATYPKSLAKLVDVYFKGTPTLARLNESDLALLGIVHFTCLVENSQMPVLAYKRKLQALENILTSVKFSQCLIFCNQVSRVETLCSDVKKFGFSATYISSAKDQAARLKAIDSLKRFKCKILVSSDVTSRGIDAENVDLIINVDVPYTTEVYLHRVGRAGRYGSKGVAITLVTKTELLSFTKIQREGNFFSHDLPDPIPEKLINFRPITKIVKEKNNDWKSSLSENQNNSDVIQMENSLSNGIENDPSTMNNSNDLDNQNTVSEDRADQNNYSTDPADFQSTSPVDSTDYQSTSSVESTDYQSISTVDSVDQNTSCEDSTVKKNTITEDPTDNPNNSSVDPVDYQNTTTEDHTYNQNTISIDSACSTEGTHKRSSEDLSANQDTISEDTSNDQNSFDTTVKQHVHSKEITVNQIIDSEGASSTNTVLTSLGVVGQNAVDKYSNKIIADVPECNSKVDKSVNEVDKSCVLIKRKDKRWSRNKALKAEKRNKLSSTAVPNSEQNFSDGGREGTENEIRKEKCNDEITLFVMKFIDDYEKKNTANLSCALVDQADKLLSLSSDKTAVTNDPLARKNLQDFYYKVFQGYKSDFIAAHGVEHLEHMMAGNKECTVVKKEWKSSVPIEIKMARIAELNKNLALKLEELKSSFGLKELESSQSCTRSDSEVDSSLEDIRVSTPNAKESRDNNTELVVSSDTPTLLHSVNYDSSDSSGSNYSSKCLQLENACKPKGTVNKTPGTSNPKSKAKKYEVSKTESSSGSESTSSSHTDEESTPQKAESRDTQSSESEANRSSNKDKETTSSSDTDSESSDSADSETKSSSDSDYSSKSDGSSKVTLLEKAFNDMMKGDNVPQTLPEQAERLKQILEKVKEGDEDNESLSGIHISTVDVQSSRKLFSSGHKSSVKSNSRKVSQNAGCSSGSGYNSNRQRRNYQSDGQEESASNSSKSSSSRKRKVSKLFKNKTSVKSGDSPRRSNRSEGSRVAEPNDYDVGRSHASRHVGSHINHWDHFANAFYAGYDSGSRPSYHSSNNHHGNCPNRATNSQCHRSHSNHHGCPRNASHPNGGHSRSTQHCHGTNGSSNGYTMSSGSLADIDMYYREWYWIQYGSLFQ